MSLPDFIRTCAELNLDGVELTGYYFPDTSRATLNTLKRLCFRLGLQISGTAMRNQFTLPDPEQRKAEVEKVKQWIDIAVALGAPFLRVFADRYPEGVSESTALEWALDCFRQVLPYAEAQGVTLALENHGGLTATAEKTLRFVHALKSDYFGLLLDCANFPDQHYRQIELLAPYAVNVHAKTHFRTPQGDYVELDYERIFAILKQAGYRGYLSIEYEYTDPPAQAIPRFAKKLLTLRDFSIPHR
jgi:sugar phosphate isomerase/epimerase